MPVRVLSASLLLLLAAACREGLPGGAVCGNKVTEGDEQCDYGPGYDGGGRCRTDCTWKRCGDGVVDLGKAIDTGNDGLGDLPEVCDPGLVTDPPCRRDCLGFAVCGNGVADPPGETCDTGPARSDTEPGACRLACQRAACGDGVVDPGEECDDHDLHSGDGCDSNCTTTRCGNGAVSDGEQCDDGNAVEVDECLASCHRNACAEGVNGAGAPCLGLRTQHLRLSITLDNNPNGVTVGDFDGDGRSDVAVTTALSFNADLLFGLGGGRLAHPNGFDSWNIPIAPVGLAAGNIDGSGRAGVFVLSGAVGGATVTALLNTGHPGVLDRVAFERISAGDPLIGPNQFALADLDADGALDLAFSGAAQLGVARIATDARGERRVQLFPRGVFSTPRLLTAGDLDGDGQAEVVFSNLSTAIERVTPGQAYFTSGAALATEQLEGPVFGLGALAAADLDGDGVDELIAAVNPPIGAELVRVYFNADRAAGPPFFERSVDLPATIPPRMLAAAPDGRIVYSDGRRVALRRFVGGAFTEEAVFRVYEDSMSIRAFSLGRLDGDGLADVAFVADGEREEVGALVTSP